MKKRKFITIIILIVLFAVVLIGVIFLMERSSLLRSVDKNNNYDSQEYNLKEWKNYNDEEWGYEISYPKDFILFEGRNEGKIESSVVISSEKDIWVTEVGPHQKIMIDIYRYLNIENNSLEQIVSHENFLEKRKIKVGEIPAIELLKEDEVSLFTYFVRDDGYIYVLRIISGTKDYFIDHQDLIREIRDTFKFFENNKSFEKDIVYKEEKLPKFEEFLVSKIFDGVFTEVNFSSHGSAFTFWTSITEGVKNGPNFAGKYRVIEIGCGTMCTIIAIVDFETGYVYFPEVPTSLGAEYRIDSNLFIANPIETIKEVYSPEYYEEFPEWISTFYYKWENNKFIKLLEIKPKM